MFNTSNNKYFLKVVPKDGTRYNPIHDKVNGAVAIIIDLTTGRRGRIAYYCGGWLEWDILNTSAVETVSVEEDNTIVVTTLNSTYYLTPVDA